jgi:HEAT repeat protein
MSITPESVKQLLDSSNFSDRIRGINQLRQIDATLALEMLIPLISDPNTRIRYAAVSALDTVGHANFNQSLALLRDRLLNDPEIDIQGAAADAIGGLKLTEAFEDLKAVYRNTSEWLLQISIIAAWGELGVAEGFDLLQDALTSETLLVQITAIGALGELGDPRAVALLTPLVNHEDWQIRHRVAQSLGHLGGDEAIQTLTILAQDSFEQVAQEAQRYL